MSEEGHHDGFCCSSCYVTRSLSDRGLFGSLAAGLVRASITSVTSDCTRRIYRIARHGSKLCPSRHVTFRHVTLPSRQSNVRNDRSDKPTTNSGYMRARARACEASPLHLGTIDPRKLARGPISFATERNVSKQIAGGCLHHDRYRDPEASRAELIG